MLDYSVFVNLLTLVLSAGILKREDVKVSLGEDATFSCERPGANGVKQVIWQQHRDDTLRNMVTFTERSKPQVDDAFVGKVNVVLASIQTTTIVIKNVTFADEACYVCTFSVYPSGTERETSCLTVHGLSEVTSQFSGKQKDKDFVVSCSASGKPKPVISWWSEEEELRDYSAETSIVHNEDSTDTTTSNLTIPHLKFGGKYVKCLAKSGNTERNINIIVDQPIDKETPVASRYYILSAVVMISCAIVVTSCVIIFHRNQRKHEKHLIEII
ncbi:OX-2 membrane glycoprotein-like isoform X2 [Tachysurus fulvidraco]|uniref:OX-2 membrane glycoprotein-like isoform X2 n=1 Tax=Tachysurus fulvidraco TaxID=1234273 RepID=UPI000F4DA2F9|nr:OX-2 membrane glycoprotein-like isoform X2 [Tachysurus fulvidraco]